MGTCNEPLTKNCFPSLVKNLEPLIEIVGMAFARPTAATRRVVKNASMMDDFEGTD